MTYKEKVKLARRMQSKKEAKIKGKNGSIFNSSVWNVWKKRRRDKELAKTEVGQARQAVKKEKRRVAHEALLKAHQN